MRFSYPYTTEVQNGATLVKFPDVPGALTEVREGENGEEIVRDCLVSALGGYIDGKLVPPAPSETRGEHYVTLDLVTSAKLALAMTMAEQHVSNVDLARRLNVTEKVIRRMLDPDHRCRIDRLENALEQLGLELELTVHRSNGLFQAETSCPSSR
jgi:antitoxin HicB